MRIDEFPFSVERVPLSTGGFLATREGLAEAAFEATDARARLSATIAAANDELRTIPGQLSDRARLRRLFRSLDAERIAAVSSSPLSADMESVVRAAAVTVTAAEGAYLKTFERRLAETRAALRRTWTDNADLAWSLYTLGEGVGQSRERLIHHVGAPDARYRKHELVFTRIAARAGMKTSPLSRFTRTVIHPPLGRVTHLRDMAFGFHNTALYELFEAVALSDIGVRQFAWEVRPYTAVVDGHVVAYTEEWNSATASVYRTRDGAVRLKAPPILVQIVESPGPWTVPAFIDTFGLSDATAIALLRRLATAGVVRPAELPSDRTDLAMAIAGRIRERLGHTRSLELDSLADKLETVSQGISILNANPSASVLADVTTRISELREEWGAHGTRTASDLVYEDSVELGPPGTPLSAALTGDLSRLLALWPLFDLNLRIQLTFRASMLAAKETDAAVTADDPILFRHAADATTAYRNFWSDPWTRIPSEVPEVALLDDLRDAFVQHLRDRSDAAEIVLDSDFIDGLLKAIPDEIAALDATYSVFHMVDDEGRLVVNKLYPGHLAFLGRFLRHLPVIEEDRTLVDEFYGGSGGMPAEIYETNGFNAAARSESMFRRRVVTRYTRDRAADAGYEEVVDLSLAPVDVSGVRPTVVGPDGTRLQPVLTSNLVRTHFPAYTAFTTNLYANINHAFECMSIFLNDVGANDSVVVTPRIRIGEVVLERRHWVVPRERLHDGVSSSSVHSHLRLVETIDAQRIPHRFYFRTRRSGKAGAPIRSLSTEFTKPQYCDLENPLLVKVFLNAIEKADLIVIAEALPDRVGAAEHVREFTVRGGNDD